jgi:hypothetical protein
VGCTLWMPDSAMVESVACAVAGPLCPHRLSIPEWFVSCGKDTPGQEGFGGHNAGEAGYECGTWPSMSLMYFQ